MGADIYLKSVNDKVRAEWEPKFYAACKARDEKYPRGEAGFPKTATQAEIEASPEQKAVHEAYEKMNGEGYFRDSYNATSLFWVLGLSWWSNDYINDSGQMRPRKCARLRAVLDEVGPITVETLETSGWLAKNPDIDFSKPGNALSDWAAMFEDKRLRLMALLDQAIELDEPLECSV